MTLLAASPSRPLPSVSPPGPPAPRPPGDRPNPWRAEGTDLLPQVEHIVIYMQENHSYDSYFGMFHRGDGYCIRDGVPTNSNVDLEGRTVRVQHAADTCQSGQGVSQSWASTHRQIDGGPDGRVPLRRQHQRCGTGTEPTCRSTGRSRTRSRCVTGGSRRRPAQTYPNRMYLQAATSQDLISTDTAKAFSMPHPAGGTIWDKLNAHGISWLDYAWDLPDIALFPEDVHRQHRTRSGRSSSSSATARPVRCRTSRS